MNFQVVTGQEEIATLLPQLKAATVPGQSNDGTRVMVHYKAANEPTARALHESALARDEGWDLTQYSGTLDRGFTNARGERCFTILCLERTNGDGRHHAYRTFNMVRGQVRQLVVLGTNNGNGNNGHNGNVHDPKPESD